MDALFWHDKKWSQEDKKLLGAGENSFWMGNAVFDGARYYHRCAPDLNLHCARLNRSASVMGFMPMLSDAELTSICCEGIKLFEEAAELYIRPMYFARGGFIIPEPSSTDCVIVIHRAPMPSLKGFAACSVPVRRPAPDAAPTNAKASFLYPMTQHALRFAKAKGFDNAIILGPNGNVAEFATSNLMIVQAGKVYTPKEDGSFLAGITRARVISLLRDAGVVVDEVELSLQHVLEADEVFSTGNYGKVLPVTKIDAVSYEIGPITRLAINQYASYAHRCALP